MMRRLTWLLGAVVVLTGCDDVPSEACDVSLREAQGNGTWLNGTWLNGTWLNGTWLNGTWLNGERLYGNGSNDYIELMSLDLKGNATVASISVVGSDLRVVTSGGQTLSGAQLVKTRFEFALDDSVKGKHTKSVWIRGAAPKSPGSDVWLYELDVKEGTGPWRPLCLDHNGEPTEAILLTDLWDPANGAKRTPQVPGTITFACRDAALAKCVEWGYRPWASVNGASLAEYHQACTRMVRADYCGDGTPHTVAGTPIHVLDQIGVQNVDPNVTYTVEAEWGPNGAVCLNTDSRRDPQLAVACSLPACGSSFASGGLIQSGRIGNGL